MMRVLYTTAALLGLTAAMAGTSATRAGAVCSVFDKRPCAPTVCSVFDKHPCAPTVCSVFRRGPCTPVFDPPIGQDLRLTIESAPAADATTVAHERNDDGAEHKLDTLRELFDALRACWVPPPIAAARYGMQMSVRLSFKRTGEIIGTPRVTYTTRGTAREVRDVYHHAVTAALARCTPMPFTSGLGGAVAGRPIAIRYVDNREQP